MYIVRKYIMATSASQAIKKDKSTPVDDCWVDDSWKDKHLASAIGLTIYPEDNDGGMKVKKK